MGGRLVSKKPRPALSNARADAAVWLARLNSEDRSRDDEHQFRAWLAESAEHQRALMEVTEAWETVGGLRGPIAYDGGRSRLARRAVLAGGAAALVPAAIASRYIWRSLSAKRYATERAELRRVALADGSAITLDTESAVDVRLTASSRRIDLLRGRARFEVAHDRTRPFIVCADGRAVTALGTTFDVAREQSGVAVMLLDGRVMVQPAKGVDRAVLKFMKPGERLLLCRGRVARLDRPDPLVESAWLQGRLVLNSQPLADAVAEMNRYGHSWQIRVDDTLASERISGSYDTHDTESFAHSVAALLGAQVEARDNLLILRRPAANMPPARSPPVSPIT